MILVTVGTQLPFDRLLKHIEQWAATHGESVVAQVGPSKLNFKHVTAHATLPQAEMERLYATARVVIAHAGMGSILSALKHRTPIIVVPRLAALKEHRNDHQLATCRWMKDRPGVTVAQDPQEATRLLENHSGEPRQFDIPEFADTSFLSKLSEWVAA